MNLHVNDHVTETVQPIITKNDNCCNVSEECVDNINKNIFSEQLNPTTIIEKNRTYLTGPRSRRKRKSKTWSRNVAKSE